MKQKTGLATVRLALAFVAIVFVTGTAEAEDVDVKYRGSVPLDTFDCEDVSRSSFVERVCYDAQNQYMIVRLHGVYYHYCEVDSETISAFLGAPSMGKYFIAYIKGSGANGPFDCRTHQLPAYQ